MLCLCFGLVACGGGAPNEKTIKAVYQETLTKEIEDAISATAAWTGRRAEMSLSLDEVTVVDKIKTDDGSWKMIVDITMTTQGIPFRSGPESGRMELTFRKGNEGWYITEHKNM